MRPAPLVVLCLALLGCGEPGDAAYAGWTELRADSGAYRMLFLDPPWDLLETSGNESLLEIPSVASKVAPSELPAYALEVTVASGAAEPSIARERRRAISRAEEVIADIAPFETESGDRGFQLFTRDTDDRLRHHRYVFVDRPGGGAVSLHFDANPSLMDREVDVMIASVEVDPPRGDRP